MFEPLIDWSGDRGAFLGAPLTGVSRASGRYVGFEKRRPQELTWLVRYG